MPSSKRVKPVTLTKTGSKGRTIKTELIEKIRSELDSYRCLFVFKFENMRSDKFKDVRIFFRDSRFFLGKNKLMQIALGRTQEEEYKENIFQLSKAISGNVGLLMTNRPKEEVISYFSNFCIPDFARAGHIAPRTIILSPQDNPLQYYPIQMLETFRKLGLVVEVKKSILGLASPFTVCTEGEPLTPESAKLLVHFDIKIAEFKVKLECCWVDGEFEELNV
jgi:mRNA turnover protein 4